MKSLAFLVIAIAVVNSQYLGKNPHGVDVFKIQMNDPANMRFRESSLFFKDSILSVLDHYYNLFPTILIDAVSWMGSIIKWI